VSTLSLLVRRQFLTRGRNENREETTALGGSRSALGASFGD
jgi:hypothetical protein